MLIVSTLAPLETPSPFTAIPIFTIVLALHVTVASVLTVVHDTLPPVSVLMYLHLLKCSIFEFIVSWSLLPIASLSSTA